MRHCRRLIDPNHSGRRPGIKKQLEINAPLLFIFGGFVSPAFFQWSGKISLVYTKAKRVLALCFILA